MLQQKGLDPDTERPTLSPQRVAELRQQHDLADGISRPHQPIHPTVRRRFFGLIAVTQPLRCAACLQQCPCNTVQWAEQVRSGVASARLAAGLL